MQCQEIAEWLSEHVDGCLDPERERLLAEHLASCPGCREELAMLEAVIAGLHALPEVEPPADLVRSVRAELDRPRLSVLAWNMLSLPQTRVAVAAGLALIIGFLGLREMGRDVAPDLTAAQDASPVLPAADAGGGVEVPGLIKDEAEAGEMLPAAEKAVRLGERESGLEKDAADSRVPTRAVLRRRTAKEAVFFDRTVEEEQPHKLAPQPAARPLSRLQPRVPTPEGALDSAVDKRRHVARGAGAEADGGVWRTEQDALRTRSVAGKRGLSVGPATPVQPTAAPAPQVADSPVSADVARMPEEKTEAAVATQPEGGAAAPLRKGKARANVREVMVLARDPALVRRRVEAWQRRAETKKHARMDHAADDGKALAFSRPMAQTTVSKPEPNVIEIQIAAAEVDALLAELGEFVGSSRRPDGTGPVMIIMHDPLPADAEGREKPASVVTLRMIIRTTSVPADGR